MLRRHLFNAHSDLSIEQVNTIFEKAVTKSNEENEKLSPEEDIGKKHALKKYDQFALNTSCFWGKYRIKNYPSCAISQIFCYNNNE